CQGKGLRGPRRAGCFPPGDRLDSSKPLHSALLSIGLIGEGWNMHAAKVLLVVLVVGSIAAAGTFYFVPTTRVGPVKEWFYKIEGYGYAQTPNEAIDRFQKALQKRDYEAAARFCGGEYNEWIRKMTRDATKLSKGVNNLSDAMKKHGIKSDKCATALY